MRALCGLRASSAWREEGEATLRRGRWAGLTLGGTWGKCCGLWGECPESNLLELGSALALKRVQEQVGPEIPLYSDV